MSRNIPIVKTWLVSYYQEGKLIYRAEILAPTKLLAKLNFHHERPYYDPLWQHAWEYADRVTYTVKRAKR